MTVSSVLRFCLVLLTLLPKLHAVAQIANRYVPHASFPLRLEAKGGDIYTVAVSPSGDIYVGGAFATVSGQLHRGLARYRSDGSLDASFNTQLGFDATVAAIAVQPDGRILVGGNFISYDGQPRYSLARLNADGSLDTSFGPTGVFDGAIYSIAIQSNGAVVVGGDFKTISGTRRLFVARLTSNGQIDATFDPGSWLQTTFEGLAIYAVALQPDGQILAGGSLLGGGSCVRFSATGAKDTSFAPDFGTVINAVHAIVVQPDGKILAGGAFNGPGPRITRLNADGSTDTTFNAGKGLDYNVSSYYLSSLALQSDGKIVAGGFFDAFNGTTADGLIRLNADGSIDSSFATTAPTNALVSSVALLPGGRVAVSRSYNFWMKAPYAPLTRLSATGATEFDYGVTTRIQGVANSACMLPNGKVVLGGYFDRVNGVAVQSLARLNVDGSVDTTFTPAGADYLEVTKIAPLADGRLVVAGRSSFSSALGRMRILQVNGTIDPSFGDRDLSPGRAVASSPAVRAIAVQSDGKFLIGGEFDAYNGRGAGYIARVNPDGSGDQTFTAGSSSNPFSNGFDGAVYTLAPLSDGKILVGGTFNTYGGIARNNLARLNADGSLDSSFTSGTGFFNFANALTPTVRGVVPQSDGKWIVGGSFDRYQGKDAAGLMRIGSDGSLDSGYRSGDGSVLSALAMLGQTDGKAIIGGAVIDSQGQLKIGLLRVTTDGSRDASFATPGLGSDLIRELAVGPNGELLVAGGAAHGNGVLQAGLAILAPSADSTAPVITTQPQSQTIAVGASITFTVVASGEPAPTFQWFKGSNAIAGATNSSYSITNAQLTDAGSYSVAVANSAGTATSNAATLTVNNPTVPPPAGGGGSGGGGGAPSIVWIIGTAVLLLFRVTFTRR